MPHRTSGRISPLLAWGVVFADIGTSVYYTPGILFNHPGIGALAGTFVFMVAVAGSLLALKYVEITARFGDGGGVVSVATSAFGPLVGALGGMLITVDYFLTSSISSVSGVHYLASLLPIGGFEAAIACVSLVLLGLLNWVGIKESAIVSLVMALAGFAIQVVVVGVTSLQLTVADWRLVGEHLLAARAIEPRTLLFGFGAAWLAFSGLETLSQLSPAMREPRQKTARAAMWLVVGAIIVTSPLLTAFSTTVLAGRMQGVPDADSFVSELGLAFGGLPLKIAVVASASALLIFAANTAIIGCYHVFLALVRGGFLPRALGARSARFGTPHYAIITATLVPAAVVVLTGANLNLLGDMYAFGLLGAFALSSVSLDRLRWIERQRGPGFLLGVVITALVVLAWGANIYAKHLATIFGTAVVLVGLGLAFAVRQGWFARLTEVGFVSAEAAEAAATEMPSARQILTLVEAVDLQPSYRAGTLLAVRGSNPRLISEAAARARGTGEHAAYVLFVDEVPGVFYPPMLGPSDEALEVLNATCHALDEEGLTAIPVWRMAHDAGASIAAAAAKLDVSAVLIGAPRRTALWHML
ncbi:MAG: APC family permease, partial [Myxococcota bacterium]